MKTRIFFRIDGGGLAKESRHSLKGKKEEKKTHSLIELIMSWLFLLVLDFFFLFFTFKFEVSFQRGCFLEFSLEKEK